MFEDVPEVVDVSALVLDKIGVGGQRRIDYRNFIRKLAMLWMNKRVTLKAKAKYSNVVKKLLEAGFDVEYTYDGKTAWFYIYSEDELIEAFSIIYNMNPKVLKKIVEEMKKFEVLFII